MLTQIMQDRNMTMYRLSKKSGVPYSTINDLCADRSKLTKCSSETIYHIAKALGVSMEELVESCLYERSDFENFKSTICHQLKEQGDIDFLIKTLEGGQIRVFYDRKWYRESFYLLAMVDYISRVNNVPICRDYDDVREQKLDSPIYPASIRALAAASHSDDVLRKAQNTADIITYVLLSILGFMWVFPFIVIILI